MNWKSEEDQRDILNAIVVRFWAVCVDNIANRDFQSGDRIVFLYGFVFPILMDRGPEAHDFQDP